ncbi:MAG: tryptophan synthase subunit alpha [Steroidobacteraceae bacterium]
MPHRDPIAEALRRAAGRGVPALVGFLTAGFPDRASFTQHLAAIAEVADVVEIGVPFSDPMADGVTIQRSSRVALEQGVTLAWILAALPALPVRPRAPLLLMSYLNPLLSYGFWRLPVAARAAGINGFIVPDLPWEECGEFRAALAHEGLALVQMVTPLTPPDRLAMLVRESQGFVYAVTATGTTGGATAMPDDVLAYLDRVRAVASLPVCAGFGIRDAAQVRRLADHADGVIVGSALVEAIERGEDAAKLLRGLRDASPPAVRRSPARAPVAP